MKPTRIVQTPRQGPPRTAPVQGFPERVCLYLHALHRDQVLPLLEGFSDRPRARALASLETLKATDSAQRQARLTREFGAVPDAVDRVHRLLLEASPPLRRALVRHLPAPVRAHFAHLESAESPHSPALDALAARLAREALRARAD